MVALLQQWAQAHAISNAQMLYRRLGKPVGSPLPRPGRSMSQGTPFSAV